MADVYGERIGQELEDEEWIANAGRRGWIILMKDAKIRCRPVELERIVGNLQRIVHAAERPGPYIYGIYARELRLLWPK
jgi:hypothetical protein